MKILYVLTNDPGETGAKIMETQQAGHDLTVFDLREDKDYGRLVDLIAASDRVVSW